MRLAILAAVSVCAALPARAVPLHWPEGTLRGFPVVRDASGKQIALGTLTQWIEDGNLHVTGTYQFNDGRVVEEQTVLSQHPELAQLRWSWEERQGSEVQRSYSIDFTTGHAVVHKRGEDVREDTLEDARKPGHAFAGVGFMYAVKNLTAELDQGREIELTAVAFTPKPRTVTVSIKRDLEGSLAGGGRTLGAERFVIHPEIPLAFVARLFVKAPDQYLWFYRPSPPAFLRADIPLAEPSDPIIHIELVGGPEPSQPQSRRPPARSRAKR
jgi:hypothetical protein